jgi:deoxyribonuclease I
MNEARARPAMGTVLAGLALLLWGCGVGSSAESGQTRIEDYEQARKLFWQELYDRGGETLYCGRQFGAGYNRGINIEHVFPMAWVTSALQCGRRKQCRETSERFNRIEADLHNLYPARTDINKARGAMSFGEIEGERRWDGQCDFEVDERRRVVEPRPAARGEIARAMFYMRDTYGLVIFDRLGARLKEWHRRDPVSVHERQRNDAIEKIQGTRNKYIDDPGLVDGLDF